MINSIGADWQLNMPVTGSDHADYSYQESIEMFDTLAEEIRREIDDEIIVTLMRQQGWFVVKYTTEMHQQLPEMVYWLEQHFPDRIRLGLNWCAFEREPDMVQFKLTWT